MQQCRIRKSCHTANIILLNMIAIKFYGGTHDDY